jgi:hypothetical protein
MKPIFRTLTAAYLLLDVSLSGCVGPSGAFAEFRANVMAKLNAEDLQRWATPIIEGKNPK